MNRLRNWGLKDFEESSVCVLKSPDMWTGNGEETINQERKRMSGGWEEGREKKGVWSINSNHQYLNLVINLDSVSLSGGDVT